MWDSKVPITGGYSALPGQLRSGEGSGRVESTELAMTDLSVRMTCILQTLGEASGWPAIAVKSPRHRIVGSWFEDVSRAVFSLAQPSPVDTELTPQLSDSMAVGVRTIIQTWALGSSILKEEEVPKKKKYPKRRRRTGMREKRRKKRRRNSSSSSITQQLRARKDLEPSSRV